MAILRPEERDRMFMESVSFAKEEAKRRLQAPVQIKAHEIRAQHVNHSHVYLVDQRSRMHGFMKALVEATHFVKSNSDPALDILQRFTRSTDRETLKMSYEEYAQNVWPRLPAIEPDDIKLLLEHLAQANPKAREINPALVIYNRLTEDIARSGIVERLYK